MQVVGGPVLVRERAEIRYQIANRGVREKPEYVIADADQAFCQLYVKGVRIIICVELERQVKITRSKDNSNKMQTVYTYRSVCTTICVHEYADA